MNPTITINPARLFEPAEVGEVVYNTKIGALMTVESFDDKLIGCIWFDREATLHREMFEPKHLMPVVAW